MNYLFPPTTITEREIRSFLQERQAPRIQQLGTWIIPGALMLAGLTFLLFNAQAYFKVQTLAESNAATPGVYLASAAATPAPTPEVAAATPTPEVAIAPAVVPVKNGIPSNTLSFADFSISAPVIWDVPLNGDIYTRLEKGLVHIEGTANPGEKGTVAIFGHSSHYPWAKGSYKTVFAPILKAKVGQTIQVSKGSTVYTYTVSKVYVINPDQMSVLNSSNESVLKLITCTPLGTSLKRHVVEAVQTSPNPADNAAFTGSQFSGQLPAGR
jgi:LPXTG-site transpeptidase (sortase) family protein